MRTFKETLESVIKFAKNDCDDLIGTLFMMGFTPRQLIYEFGFDKDTVLQHPDFRDFADACGEYNEGDEVYPFILDEYNPLEAAIVSRYCLSRKQMEKFLETKEFENLKNAYKERIVEVETDLFNEILDEFEDATLLELGKIINGILDGGEKVDAEADIAVMILDAEKYFNLGNTGYPEYFEESLPHKKYVFENPNEFIEHWHGMEGEWYWVFYAGELICSGAIDPDDIEIFEEHFFGIRTEE